MEKRFFGIVLGLLLLSVKPMLGVCGKVLIKNYTNYLLAVSVKNDGAQQKMLLYGKGEKKYSWLPIVGNGGAEISLGALKEAIFCGLKSRYLSPLFIKDNLNKNANVAFTVVFDRTAGDVPTLVIKEVLLGKANALLITKENWS